MSVEICVVAEELVIRNKNSESVIWKGKPNGFSAKIVKVIPEEGGRIALLKY